MSELTEHGFEEAIRDLVPTHQIQFLTNALNASDFDFDRAGQLLTGEYKPNGAIVQTSLILKKDSMWLRVQNEVFDFLCTSSAKYKDERKEAGLSVKQIVQILATSLAASYHIALGVVTGVVTLALMSVFKVTKNAWCGLHKNKLKAE